MTVWQWVGYMVGLFVVWLVVLILTGSMLWSIAFQGVGVLAVTAWVWSRENVNRK